MGYTVQYCTISDSNPLFFSFCFSFPLSDRTLFADSMHYLADVPGLGGRRSLSDLMDHLLVDQYQVHDALEDACGLALVVRAMAEQREMSPSEFIAKCGRMKKFKDVYQRSKDAMRPRH